MFDDRYIERLTRFAGPRFEVLQDEKSTPLANTSLTWSPMMPIMPVHLIQRAAALGLLA